MGGAAAEEEGEEDGEEEEEEEEEEPREGCTVDTYLLSIAAACGGKNKVRKQRVTWGWERL